MSNLIPKLSALTVLLFFASQINAQLIGTHAYMKGDYVEVGINEHGDEGAPCPDDIYEYHCRGGASDLFGFVSNPQMDGWVEFNGDFFTPGSPECGFGIGYTLLGTTYDRGNNHDIYQIPGSITDYTETTDSESVTWVGSVDSLQLTILYELEKSQHFYSTSMQLENLGSETFVDVYYYHNFDPDNNQPISGTFTTDNEIISQSGMADDSVIVRSSQTMPWYSEVSLVTYGTDWKAYSGGFSNRNASDMWTGGGGLSITEGYTSFSDQAIGLVYNVASITTAKTASEVFTFATTFRGDALADEEDDDSSNIDEDENNNFNLYPNPNNGQSVTIDISGAFSFNLVDTRGRLALSGNGVDKTEVDLSTLQSGVYFIQLNQNGNITSKKLVIK